MQRVAAGWRRWGDPDAAGRCRGLLAVAIAICLPGLLTAADHQAAASRVAVTLEVRGELFAEANPDQAPLSQPIRLDARFDFTEAPASGAEAAVIRRYDAAVADSTAGDHTTHTSLATDARELLVTLQGTTPSPYLAESFLAREEADLLEMPFDPVLVDGMRPPNVVTAAAGWKVPADLTAGLLAIDTVESGSLEATLTAVHDGLADVAIEGTVTGAVDGAPSRIVVTGSFRCGATAADGTDAWLLNGRIGSLEVEISERREAGWVAPGLDVTAHLTLTRSPVGMGTDADQGAAAAPAAADQLGPAMSERPRAAGRPGTVWERHRQGRYTLVLDDRWRVVEDGPQGLVMRLMDHGALVAQCSILPLPRIDPTAAPAVETVGRDVERSLGDQFGAIVAAEETTRSDGTRVVRVVAEGTAEDRPFRWIHHVLTDSAGHRAAITCMHEPAVADRFAIADRELVAGLVLTPDRPASTGREARLPPASADRPKD